jgi:8-oxo-dGTP pyrophosphatase MutT (NUDIX family)
VTERQDEDASDAWDTETDALERAPRSALRIAFDVPPEHPSAIDAERAGEVCMVVRRATSDGWRYVIGTKPFYLDGIARLLTGGLHEGESVLDGFGRELYEETGLDAAGARYLGRLEFRLDGRRALRTFVFVRDISDEALEVTDPDEALTLLEVPLAFLEREAARMAALPSMWSVDLEQDWAAWGWLRSTMQRAVIDVLRSLDSRGDLER